MITIDDLQLKHTWSTLQALDDVSGEEFETFMEVLSKLQYTSTLEGAQEIGAIIAEQAELSAKFQVCVCSCCVCGWCL